MIDLVTRCRHAWTFLQGGSSNLMAANGPYTFTARYICALCGAGRTDSSSQQVVDPQDSRFPGATSYAQSVTPNL